MFKCNFNAWEGYNIMPESYYEKMKELYKELNIELEDTDEKQKIINANNFIATFTPKREPIKIE